MSDDLFDDNMTGTFEELADKNRAERDAVKPLVNLPKEEVKQTEYNTSLTAEEHASMNTVRLNLNIAKFTNIEIELNDISTAGKQYIKERIELAMKYVDKYKMKEVG